MAGSGLWLYGRASIHGYIGSDEIASKASSQYTSKRLDQIVHRVRWEDGEATPHCG